jgi:MinD-like ATPase involved in chromosome partitioning or flagellar assembly
MVRVITFNSYRRGTGKSTLLANLATLFASRGKRVGMIDFDLIDPAIHRLFGFKDSDITHYLNHYLLGRHELPEIMVNLTNKLHTPVTGHLVLIPAGTSPFVPATGEQGGFDLHTLNKLIKEFRLAHRLDYILIDNQPGLNEESLSVTATADELAIVLRLDQQDYQGTGVMLDVVRKLDYLQISLIVNMVTRQFDNQQVKDEVTTVYQTPVSAVVSYTKEIRDYEYPGQYILDNPSLEVTRHFNAIAVSLINS